MRHRALLPALLLRLAAGEADTVHAATVAAARAAVKAGAGGVVEPLVVANNILDTLALSKAWLSKLNTKIEFMLFWTRVVDF